MKTKNLVILGVLLILVVSATFLSERLSSKKSESKDIAFFPGLAKDKCSSFQITDKEGTVKLTKTPEGWMLMESATAKQSPSVSPLKAAIDSSKNQQPASSSLGLQTFEQYKADSASVEAVLEKLLAMKKDELASQNQSKQTIFEVDSAQGTFVEVWDAQNKQIGALYIGKNGADWNSNFVREKNSQDVYSVRGSIKYSFFTDKKRWRDKTVLSFDKNLVKRVSLAKKDSAVITLEKTLDSLKNPLWTLTSPTTAKTNKEAVDRLITELSHFTTNEWEDSLLSEQQLSFNAPYLAVHITMDNGTEKTLTLGNKKGTTTDRFMKSSDMKDVLFRIYESRVNDVDKTFNSLKEKDTTTTPAPVAATISEKPVKKVQQETNKSSLTKAADATKPAKNTDNVTVKKEEKKK